MAKILFIDRRSSNLGACQVALMKGVPDCDITVAENVRDGIKKAALKPNLIILDINEGNMDSFDICHILKNEENLRDIPLMILVGSDELEKFNEHILDCDADIVLKKPLVITEFISITKLLIKLSANIGILKKERTFEGILEEEREKNSNIHHRVKNNMQIINSMLNLQAKFTRDSYDKVLFEDAQNRVRALSLIHDNLYKTHQNNSIDFCGYIQKLIYQLHLSYRLNKNFKIKVDCENVVFSLSSAVPVGLLINEILADVLKKLKHQSEAGNVVVKLVQKLKAYRLQISSDQLPNSDIFDYNSTRDFTSLLVKTLVSQLHGDLEYENGSEPALTVSFLAVDISYTTL